MGSYSGSYSPTPGKVPKDEILALGIPSSAKHTNHLVLFKAGVYCGAGIERVSWVAEVFLKSSRQK
jgi:hypothetical protein